MGDTDLLKLSDVEAKLAMMELQAAKLYEDEKRDHAYIGHVGRVDLRTCFYCGSTLDTSRRTVFACSS